MPFINDHNNPPRSLLDSLDDKVNAGSNEPRVMIEFDKLVYVPGIKFKYETLEQIYNSSITPITTSVNTGSDGGVPETNGNSPMIGEMQKLGEPTAYNPSNPTSGARFEYIKCMLMTYLVDACLPVQYYPFMLAVAWHETGFGTLGQGRPQNGSFIVGYGCPGSCNMTYKSIKTQARMFAKRIKDAMKTKHQGIINRGYLTADDINYFHQGGDYGYNVYIWSADGANWKSKVKSYYDQIRSEMGSGVLQPLSSSQSKWKCSKQGSGLQNMLFTNSACPQKYTQLGFSSSQTTASQQFEEGDIRPEDVAPMMTLEEALRPPEGETDVFYITDDEVIDIPPTQEELEAETVDDIIPINADIINNMTASAGSSGITFPLANKTYNTSVLTSRFYTENKDRPTHYGVDLVPARGKCNGWTIVAAWDGKVTKAGWVDGAGYMVQITHNNGFATHYFHMQKGSIMVHKNQTVKAGTPLGKCGNTGNSKGAHLHFEMIKAGSNPWAKASKINPRPYLEGSAKASVNVASLPGGGDGGGTVTGEIIKNKVFDYCLSDKLKTMNSKYFTDVGSGSYFTKYDNKTKQDVNVFGFKAGSIDEVDSLTCVHKFTADGLFEAKLYINLQSGDNAYIRVDGKTYASFTSADNGVVSIEPIYMSFINSQGSDGSTTAATESNEHVIDLYVQDQSGKAEIGYMCVTLSELEGGAVSQSAKYRRRVDWIEQGDVVFEKTIMLDKDIQSWEVTNHFDADSSTARVTLDNTSRIYSPTYVYNDLSFPRNNIDSEFSYFEQGELRHVISEGTPVRIYAGYGDDLVRVFTGFITGEVEDDADGNSITFECVDMYSLVENHIFMSKTSYPEVNIHEEITNGVSNKVNEGWVMSSIIHNIANKSGLSGWRIVEDDLQYPDIVIQETYYIDIDKGAKVATVWDSTAKRYVKKTINTVKTLEGYKNPYVMSIDFEQGTRASDAIHQLIGDTMFKAYCDRYGTFRLEHLIRMYDVAPKWEFTDTVNLTSLNTSVDYTRTRNHLMILGNQGQTEHFVDKDLIRATRGRVRTAQVEVDWIDESYGASAYGEKKAVADRLFLDMKRQSRTFNADVKGNPLIDVLDGCYIYSEDSSVQGYYIVKGHTLRGNAENMVSSLELTWGINGYSTDL